VFSDGKRQQVAPPIQGSKKYKLCLSQGYFLIVEVAGEYGGIPVDVVKLEAKTCVRAALL